MVVDGGNGWGGGCDEASRVGEELAHKASYTRGVIYKQQLANFKSITLHMDKTHTIMYFILPLLHPTANKNFGLPVTLEFECYLRRSLPPPPNS